jgi:hypothetical protein
MAICHALWKSKLLKNVALCLTLHRYSVRALIWVTLLLLLLKSYLTDDSSPKFREHLRDAISDVVPGLVRESLDVILYLACSLLLGHSELFDTFGLARFTTINELLLLHFHHESPMHGQMSAIVWLQNK